MVVQNWLWDRQVAVDIRNYIDPPTEKCAMEVVEFSEGNLEILALVFNQILKIHF